MNNIYYCSISGKVIPDARVEYLLESGLPIEKWTVKEHSSVTKVKGIFLQPGDLGEGEVDTSSLIIVNKVYNDTVRSIMGDAATDADPDGEEADTSLDVVKDE